MALDYKTVDHAGEMYDALEEAISSLEGAIDSMKGLSDLKGYVDALKDMIDEMKDEQEPFIEILDQDAREEQEYLEREYWRAVI